jgi:ribonuclease VapC
LILDSSAVVAVILEEEGHARLADAIADSTDVAIGAPTLFETCMVLVGYLDLRGRGLIAQFLERNGVVIVPFDDRHWSVAAEAFIRYGKGRHPAALNYGDCMTYATAQVTEHPLLFTGDDFSRTDLVAALS